MAAISMLEVSPGELTLPSDATDAQYKAYVAGSYTPVYHPVGYPIYLSAD